MYGARAYLATQARRDVDTDPQVVRALIRRCLEGDAAAAEDFQRTYGEMIYSYPINVYRIRSEEAGDFYVFAFDRGRLFRRLRTYEGRAPFRAYLFGFVLDDLVLEWKRTQRTLDTVSIDDIGELPEPVDVVHAGDATDYAWLRRAFERLDPTRALVLKLLYIEDWDLTAQEMRTLAETSGRSLAEVVRGIEELRALVREREASLKDVEENLGTVLAWVQLFERRLWCIDAELAVRPSDRLRAEAAELRRKLERRQRQRTKLMGRAKRRQITAPYKAIAALFNTTVGNIASQIARARQELREKGLALQG